MGDFSALRLMIERTCFVMISVYRKSRRQFKRSAAESFSQRHTPRKSHPPQRLQKPHRFACQLWLAPSRSPRLSTVDRNRLKGLFFFSKGGPPCPSRRRWRQRLVDRKGSLVRFTTAIGLADLVERGGHRSGTAFFRSITFNARRYRDEEGNGRMPPRTDPSISRRSRWP